MNDLQCLWPRVEEDFDGRWIDIDHRRAARRLMDWLLRLVGWRR